MNLTQLLLRALAPGSEADRVRFMAEVGRMIARQVRAIDMWEVENGPRYFGYADHRRWADLYPPDFESNLSRYAEAEPTTDFFLGSDDPTPPAGEPEGAAAPERPRRPSPFEEAFCETGRLARMARLGDDIGGYLAAMVRTYLLDRQEDNDPFGYRVFKNLEAVIESLEVERVVAVTGRVGVRRRIRRSSYVRFRTAAPDGAGHGPAVEALLATPALAGNVHKLAKLGRGAQRLLRAAVEALPLAGIEAFQFGDLLVPLQGRVREAARLWAGDPLSVSPTQSGDGPKIATENRIVAPVERYSTLDEHLAALAARVRAAIDAGGYQERTRLGLHRVLDDWFDHLAETQADGEEHPRLTEWAIRLGLRRATLGDHVQRLRGIIAQVNAERTGDGP